MRLTGMTHTTDNPNPLILLDIDGVINDLNALGGLHRDWGIDQVYSHGHTVHIEANNTRNHFSVGDINGAGNLGQGWRHDVNPIR